MSRLKDLIQELCPDGVEYRPLGEVATEMYRGAGIKREEVSESGYPCIRYGEIHTTYKIWFDKCVSHTDESIHPSKKYAEYGDILFAITSEDVENVGNSVAYVGNEKILVGGDIVVMKHNQNPKYLAYALSTTDAVKQKGKGKVKSKVVHTSVPSLQEIEIPVPPMAVQEEIVRILDKFSVLQIQLQSLLQEEKQKRIQQYHYYRDKLLSFNGIEAGKVRWMKLGDICEKIASGSNKERSIDGVYPVFGSTGIIGKTNTAKFHKPLILVARVGANAGYVQIAIGEYDITDNTMFVEVKSGVNMKYIYYLLDSLNLNQFVKGGGQPLLTAGLLKTITIPVPPLSEQERIVAILDRFDTLCNDLTSGIPAEIEGRRKQYEYYRDQLLTFKAKS